MFSTALAQTAAQAPEQPSLLMTMLPLVFVFLIFYFIVIRPSKKQREDEIKMQNALEKGDEVFTRSGILGKIVGITDRIITLEVDEKVKIRFLKGEIAGKTTQIFSNKEEKK